MHSTEFNLLKQMLRNGTIVQYLKKVKNIFRSKNFFLKKSTYTHCSNCMHKSFTVRLRKNIYSNLYDISMWPIKKMEKQNVNIQV